ncbi:MAG: hypothetical protein M0R46_00310 [Candidatus Muirbacterium halophilum]|nr:hypothetical protein [Candidatus Muirbacterium halophilum]MCK9474335.1 hypothetical protein [Candidatus Muirbacterium halophilum]
MKKSVLIILLIISILSNVNSYTVENNEIWVAFDFFNEKFTDFETIDADVAFRVLNIWGNTLEEGNRYADDIEQTVQKIHKIGRKTSGMFGGISISSKDEKSFIEKAGARNPEGIITSVDSLTLHGCYNRLEWQKRLKEIYKIFSKHNIDYMEMDQPAQEHWRGECYCDVCIKDFEKYLHKNNIIPKTNPFNYIDYLMKKRIHNIREGDRERYSEFGSYYWQFQIEKDWKNVGRLTLDFKNINPLMKFFGNTWGLAGEYIESVKFYDMTNVAGDMRTPFIWEPARDRFGPPYNSWIPAVKIAHSLGNKNIISFLDTYPYERLLKEHKEDKDYVFNIVASEFLASGATFVFPYSNRVAYNQYGEFNKFNLRRFMSFIKNNREFFEKRKTNPQILLKASKQQTILTRFHKQYWAIAYYLIDNGLDYDFAFTETKTDEEKYKIVIDCDKYHQNIFNYTYDKNEKFIAEDIKELISKLQRKITVNEKNTRVFIYDNMIEGNNYMIAVTQKEQKQLIITINSNEKLKKIVSYPQTEFKIDKQQIIFSEHPALIAIQTE